MTAPTRRVSARLAAIAPSATLAVDSKAKALKAAGRPVVGFGAGEPDFPTPDYIVEAAVEACRVPANHRYTPAGGLPELKKAIVEKTIRDTGYAVEPSQVLVTNGGKQAIYEAFATLLDPGDTVVCDSGDHASILDAVALSRARVRPFRHNRLDKLESMLSRAESEGELAPAASDFLRQSANRIQAALSRLPVDTSS